MDSNGDGWHGGSLGFNGKEYCNDFLNGKEQTEVVSIHPTEVCFDVSMHGIVWIHEASWSLGPCKGGSNYSPLSRSRNLIEKCCLPPGEHVLTCNDAFGDGWPGGYLDIQGQKYCNNFDWGHEVSE